MDQFDPLALRTPLAEPPSTPTLLSPTPAHVGGSTHHAEAHMTQAQAASMRRKKNADAQAAFRARRANYIASLEETVTSLEAVVLSLQDTCREARNDAEDLRHENAKMLNVVDALKQAHRDREKEWRDFWDEKQQALGLDMNDLPPRAGGTPPTTGELAGRAFADEGLRFPGAGGEGYVGPKDGEGRYAGAALQPFTANPEGNWIPGPFSNTRTPCVGEGHPSQSSSASDSPPSLSPGVAYSGRFGGGGGGGEEAAGGRLGLVMPYGRGASTPSLVSSDALYTFGEVGGMGTHEYAGSEAYHERYGSGRGRRAYSGPASRGEVYGGDAGAARASSPLQMTHAESEGVHGEGQLRPRRHTAAGLLPGVHSRSSSPPPPPPPPSGASSGAGRDREAPMSNTLAVIKAQAFGSLRRTRTRTKRPSDSASKVAIDILSARGIGMGVQVAAGGVRKRRGEDDVDMGV